MPVKQTAENFIYEPDTAMLRELQSKVRIVESKKDWTKLGRPLPLANASQTRTAYVAQLKMENETDAMLDVIIIYDAKTNKFYEIRSFGNFLWRLFSDFKWISDDVLQFRQWVNLNNGGRYQVNVRTGKIIAAGYVRSN